MSEARTSLTRIAISALPSGLAMTRCISQKHRVTKNRMKKYWKVASARVNSVSPKVKVGGSEKLMPSSPPVIGLMVRNRK